MENIRHNKKYKALMETGRRLFWKHGFRRVSVEEVCEEAKVSKMTFYKYFPNKFELAKAVFMEVVEKGVTDFKSIMASDLPVGEKMHRLIMTKVEGTNEVSREFLADFYLGAEPELKEFVEKTTTDVWNELIKDYRKAQDEGILRNDFKPELLLKISTKLVELLKDESLLAMYDTPQDLLMEFTNLLVYGVAPHSSHEK
jgi:AcrR family transcriptional regulator